MAQDESELVDMLGVARIAQGVDESSEVERFGVKVVAPAKVNLFLSIGSRRADGYHEATSIMHALSLHDVLYMAARPPREEAEAGRGLVIDLACRFTGGVAEFELPAEDNTIVRAARLLAQRIGRERDEVLCVHLKKYIPAQAGLGGGSADAAATLVGCANLWGLAPDDPRIEQVAREVGADVPFFLHGGCVCLTGAGDVFDHALKPRADYVVLVRPEAGVSTAQAYRAFDEAPTCIDAADSALAAVAARAAEVPLRNNLAPASERLLPELAEVRAWLAERLGADAVLLAGSGSTTFAVAPSFPEASRIASEARTHGWWARATTFSPIRAAIVPQDD